MSHHWYRLCVDLYLDQDQLAAIQGNAHEFLRAGMEVISESRPIFADGPYLGDLEDKEDDE